MRLPARGGRRTGLTDYLALAEWVVQLQRDMSELRKHVEDEPLARDYLRSAWEKLDDAKFELERRV